METVKLYYQDPFLREFTARVLTCEPYQGVWRIVLDRTAFYPEGGGQPADHGDLNGVPVTDVHEKDGAVLHTCARPLSSGETVTGRINWARRFDHMQQHSGEHICSGIICSRYHCDNVGFHLGADLVTIDFNADIPPEDLPQIEALANQYVYENHPIDIRLHRGPELETLDYRSKKPLEGDVRIVTFPGADCCACCGTHVRSAGQVGLVKLLSAQKFREGVRIELVCGNRAFRYLSGVMEQNARVSHLLSAKVFETGAAVERLLTENETLKARLACLEDARFTALAGQYAGAGDILLFEDGLSPDSLRRLCDAVLHSCGGRCACFSGDDSSGYKYTVGQAGGDLRNFVKQLNQSLSGRGGGKPDFVQGSVQADRQAIETFFHHP